MTLQLRALLIMAAALVAFFLLPRALERLGLGQTSAFLLALVLLAVGTNGLLHLALRCPQCGKWACRRPDGHATLFPGPACRYCGTAY